MRRGHRSSPVFGDEDYWILDDLCLPLSSSAQEDGSFTLCFWIYVVKSCQAGFVLRMVCSESKEERPLLTIDQDKMLSLHSWSRGSVSAQQTCPLEKWVHIGCEVGNDVIRLHMDGVVVAEKLINGLVESNYQTTIILMGGNGCNSSDYLQGYAHHVRVLPQPTVTNHYVKHPPLELSLDGSTGASDDHEVEEGGDGIWSVVGGKASCRRNFALDVVLLDALGRSVHKDMEIIALLVYADNGVPVEKPKDDAEAPLLTTFDGVEFPSTERPIKLVHGRASFKLKISQLSSKCDNRLFRVCFDSPSIPSYPFLRVFSRPIRCVSRNRNSRVPAAPWKRCITSTEASWLPEEAVMETPLVFNNSLNVQAASKCYLGQYPMKRARVVPEVSSFVPDQSIDLYETPHNFSTCDIKALPIVAQKDVHSGGSSLDTRCLGNEQCYVSQSPSSYSVQTDSTLVVDHSTIQERYQEESDMPKTVGACKLTHAEVLSDFLVFKYSLENIHSRAAFLKGAITCWSDQDLSEFAKRVSHATSCEHNGHQIVIARKLIQDGNEAWNQIVKDAYSVPWDIMVEHVEKHFMNLSTSKKRRFSSKDKFFLRQLAKCKECVSREEFDRLWYWIYPVSLSLLNSQVRMTWEIEEPKWILGMASREEAEALLRSQDVPRPGAFMLRFVSTCSWPHPDAGGLIVSYIGQDLRIHHKLLSLDSISGLSIGDKRSLSELILAQEELSQPFR